MFITNIAEIKLTGSTSYQKLIRHLSICMLPLHLSKLYLHTFVFHFYFSKVVYVISFEVFPWFKKNKGNKRMALLPPPIDVFAVSKHKLDISFGNISVLLNSHCRIYIIIYILTLLHAHYCKILNCVLLGSDLSTKIFSSQELSSSSILFPTWNFQLTPLQGMLLS